MKVCLHGSKLGFTWSYFGEAEGWREGGREQREKQRREGEEVRKERKRSREKGRREEKRTKPNMVKHMMTVAGETSRFPSQGSCWKDKKMDGQDKITPRRKP